MTRHVGNENTYGVADLFRKRCLTGTGSLLWKNAQPWTSATLDTLWSAFFDHPDISPNKSFEQKLHDQLANTPDEVVQVATDAIAFYLLYPTRHRGAKKLALIEDLVSWRTWADEPDLGPLEHAYREGGIGFPGTFYNTGRPWHFALLIRTGQRTILNASVVENPISLAATMDLAQDAVSDRNVSLSRNVYLHVLFPEYFERVATDKQRREIVERFKDLAPDDANDDAKIYTIRNKLADQYARPKLDFYDNDIEPLWRSGYEIDDDEEPVGDGPPAHNTPRVWIEKTRVLGRPDRTNGDYAMGKALWSPQRSRNQQDIYRFMREAKPGDFVIHLTDNRGFTGVSRVSAPYEDFGGIAGTEWGEGPSYLVRLQDFRILEPPLGREVFFGPPFDAQLVRLLEGGLRNVFYNSEPSLNQGMYLTPATPEVVEILNSAYRTIADSDLIPSFENSPLPPGPVPIGRSTIEALIQRTHLSTEEIRELESIARERRQLILEGPPGSGKTYIATLLARYLADDQLDGDAGERVLTVQFHQSYGYEDFVEGIRPSVTSAGQVTYEVKPGVFKAFCERAESNPDSAFVVVIDEINRGNTSRILGELLFLLEYRNRSIRLPYSGASGAAFRIPENVILLGTMNSTDRSLAQLDYALRRRFYFYKVAPVHNGMAPVLESWLRRQSGLTNARRREILAAFLALNARVTAELGPDYQIGHSYLMVPGLADDAVIHRVWRRAIEPLLEEYFHNRKNRDAVIQGLSWEALRASEAAPSGSTD